MFFIKAGKVVAWISVILGFFMLGIALSIAFVSTDMEVNSAAAQRYLNVKYTGVAIDQAIISICFGITLGILSEIGKAVVGMRSN